MRIAHFPVEFRLGYQRGHRIHHQNIDGARTHQGFGDFERLLAVIGLGEAEIIDIHAQLFGILRIERVFSIDKGGHATRLLRFSDDLQRDGGLAR